MENLGITVRFPAGASRGLSEMSTLAVGHTEPQCVLEALPPGVKQPGRGSDRPSIVPRLCMNACISLVAPSPVRCAQP